MPTALLLGYDLEQPSFRHRMQTLVEPLRASGWQVRSERFPTGRYGLRTVERRALLRWADVVVLHQIKLSAWEARLLAAFARRRVFDVDDAIYVRKPRQLGDAVGDSRARRRKFTATCRLADTVAAGNEVLATVARAHASEVAVLPTSLDPALYHAATLPPEAPPTIVWIGTPGNLLYLEIIRPALARLTTRHPSLKLRVVCSAFPRWPELNVEAVQWTAASEAAALAAAHIGVMPLTDDEWTRGKCAFKLLQYMAASLPCVASPVGANTEAIIAGVTGLHADDVDGWERSLEQLIESPPLRQRLGAAGRAHVEQHYSMRVYRQNYAEMLQRLASS